MPIDFASIAERFQGPIKFQLTPISMAFTRIGKWVKRRLERAQALERASRDFPIIQFYNGALTLRIDRSQYGAIVPPEQAPSIWDHLRAGGESFLRGVSRVGGAIQEELTLPRLLGTLGDILETTVEIMEGFPEPGPEWFDLSRPRHASELIGEAPYMGLALAGGTERIRSFTESVSAIMALFCSSGREEGGGDLVSTLRDAVRYIVGALLILPVLSRLISLTVDSTALAARYRLLDELERIEAEVFALRGEIIDFFYTDLTAFGQEAVDFLLATGYVITTNFGFFLRFVELYVRGLLSGIREYATQLSNFFAHYVGLISTLRSMMSELMRTDLGALISEAIGLPIDISLTLDDLVAVLLGERPEVRDLLNAVLLALESDRVVGFLLGDRIQALREVLQITLTPRPFIPETRLPTLPAGGFPDIFAAFFGPGAPPIAQTLAGLRDQLRTDVSGIMTAGVDFLRGTARTFSAAAARAATLGSPGRYRAIAERATSMAEGIFRPQVTELRRAIRSREPDPLVQALEGAVARGGFHVLGEVIAIYVGEMRRYWLERSTPESEVEIEAPTSPHILARRAVLGRVRVPNLTIRASGRELTADLVAEIANQFRGAIENAYRAGVAQVEAG